MAVFNKFNSFVEHLAEGVHNFQDHTLKVALVAAANAPVATNTVLADLVEINYANASSRTVVRTASSQTNGVYKLVVQDLVITANGGSVGPFRYVIVYNDTPTSPADPLIGWYDYNSDIELAINETLTVDFDQVNGLLTIAVGA